MEKPTDHKVPVNIEKDEFPDFIIFPANFFDNLLPSQSPPLENSGEDKENGDYKETSQPEARSNSSTQQRKRSIVVLEDEEIEEFEMKQISKNTAKLTECAV